MRRPGTAYLGAGSVVFPAIGEWEVHGDARAETRFHSDTTRIPAFAGALLLSAVLREADPGVQ